MPVQECQKGGKSGHRWGSKGVCFTGSDSRAKAAEVGRAIHAQEKRMDRLQLLKGIAHGEDISKTANLSELVDIGMTALMLNNVLNGRSPGDDGPVFEKSNLDGLFGPLFKFLKAAHPPKKKKKDKHKVMKEGKTGLLDQLKQLITKAEAVPSYTEFSSSPMIGEQIAKSVDESRGLVTAIILRPDVVDLHGDIYDAVEVEKACFNFNTRCRQTNVQHEQMADFDMVESYIAKADFVLGEGQVLKDDWLGTMHIDPQKHQREWDMVKSGQFTGFSIGCKASVETI